MIKLTRIINKISTFKKFIPDLRRFSFYFYCRNVFSEQNFGNPSVFDRIFHRFLHHIQYLTNFLFLTNNRTDFCKQNTRLHFGQTIYFSTLLHVRFLTFQKFVASFFLTKCYEFIWLISWKTWMRSAWIVNCCLGISYWKFLKEGWR